MRAFLDDQNSATQDYALMLDSRLRVDLKHKPFRVRLRVFGRVDEADQQRSFAILEEAWMQWSTKKFSFRLGMDLLNWTATEAFHPADIINSRNLDSDLENYQKIGEPSARVRWRYGGGSVQAYFLPAFSAPLMPSARSRLNFLGANEFQIVFADRAGKRNNADEHYQFVPQGAVRWQHTFDDFELSLHLANHISRGVTWPALKPGTSEGLLVFPTISQAGGTLQWVLEPILVKAEWALRKLHQPSNTDFVLIFGSPPDHHAVLATGLEFTEGHENGSETTFVAECQGVLGVTRKQAEQLEQFQADMLLGLRHAFNDEASREILLTSIGDVEHWNQMTNSVAYQQRMWEHFILKISFRHFLALKSSEVNLLEFKRTLYPLRDADYIRISLTRFF